MKEAITQELNQTAGQDVDVACSECRRRTRHAVRASVDVAGTTTVPGGFSVDWGMNYQIVQCLGCETISFRKLTHNSATSQVQYEDGSGGFEPDEELFPNPEVGRTPIKDVELLPSAVQRIYSETLRALTSQQLVLAGVGIRALIEAVAKEKGATGKDLMARIDNLVILGILSTDGVAILHKLRNLGNEAAHEVRPHSEQTLGVALDVVEHLLQGVYILPHNAQKTFK